MELPIGVLSGGERRRVELARILFAGSDVLCLDEPTNHLDIDAKLWLMGFLRQYRGALLVISHDLDLLDEAITRVLHLDRPKEAEVGTLVEYKGTYSQYIAARAEDERRLAKLAAQQEREIVRMQRFVDRFGAKATKASLAHSMEKRIARLEDDRVHAPKQHAGDHRAVPRPAVVRSDGARGRAAVQGLRRTARVRGRRLRPRPRRAAAGARPQRRRQDRRCCASWPARRDADLGQFAFGHNVVAGYYAQEHDNLDPHASVLDNLRNDVPPGIVLTETELRGLLGMMGLSGEKVFQEAGTLSGGEKTKLALAMLMVGRNNLLLLDEPTNNLDPPSRQAVANALTAWKGSIVFVSHDTEFVHTARAHQGAADARRRRRLLQRRLARSGQPRVTVARPYRQSCDIAARAATVGLAQRRCDWCQPDGARRRVGQTSQVKVLPVVIGGAVAVGLLAGAIAIDRSRTGAEDVQVVFGEEDGLPEDLERGPAATTPPS